MGGGEASGDSRRDGRAARELLATNESDEAAADLVTAIASLLPAGAGSFAVFEPPGPNEVRLARAGGSFAAELGEFVRWFELRDRVVDGAGVGAIVTRTGTLPVSARELLGECTATTVPIHGRDGRVLGLVGGFVCAGEATLSSPALRGLEALATAFFQGLSQSTSSDVAPGAERPAVPGRSTDAKDARTRGLEQLSPQERLVAGLLVNGYHVSNVAASTGLAHDTVRTYIRRIYRKLGVRNRADLVRTVLVTGDATVVLEREHQG